MPADVVRADPTKEFFVYMITKDITLEEALLDLIDNSADAARKAARATGNGQAEPNYSPYEIKLEFGDQEFSIVDNCGGIPVDIAKDYAFRFGRRGDATHGLERGIGLYGIGMKRAIFKLGKSITVESATDTESFVLNLEVGDWVAKEEEATAWDFPITTGGPLDWTGTRISVNNLYPVVAGDLGDKTFANDLIDEIGKTYARFLSHGLSIKVNKREAQPFIPPLLRDPELEFEPLLIEYIDEYNEAQVNVTIKAGWMEPPPDDLNPSEVKDRRAKTSGWYVSCNGRTVLVADKTDRTVWGNGDFTRMHTQYYGFVGQINFESNDPGALPWTTTKQDVVEDHPVYRRALSRMKDATTPFIRYTNERKSDLEKAKDLEKRATRTSIDEINTPNQKPKLPSIQKARVKKTTIQFQRRTSLIKKLGASLGLGSNAAAKSVGEAAFDRMVELEGVED